MNKFYEIIYHPSRFAPLVYLNMLIYRYLNCVIDTSKTEKSITLSITIWGYPSRFSHYTLSDTAYHCWKAYNGLASEKVTVSWHEIFCFIPWNCSFQAEKHFVSSCETNRQSFCPYIYLESYSWWRLTINVSILLPPLWFCFTRNRIQLLLHNDQQKNVRDNPKSWWIAWWIL